MRNRARPTIVALASDALVLSLPLTGRDEPRDPRRLNDLAVSLYRTLRIVTSSHCSDSITDLERISSFLTTVLAEIFTCSARSPRRVIGEVVPAGARVADLFMDQWPNCVPSGRTRRLVAAEIVLQSPCHCSGGFIPLLDYVTTFYRDGMSLGED